MIDVIDGPGGVDDWAHVNYEEGTIWFEESDTTKKLTTADFMFKRGKYENSLLSEVGDTWYLKFIRDKNPDDYLIEFMFNKRIDELK